MLGAGWKGIIVAEGLEEPSLINEFEVFKARISKSDQDLGDGKVGRWHLYYVFATDSQIDTLAIQMRSGWYCHFWRGDALVAVFRGKKFEMVTRDKSTWRDAIDFGATTGIPENELDFPTE
jgi:hypothetical protein